MAGCAHASERKVGSKVEPSTLVLLYLVLGGLAVARAILNGAGAGAALGLSVVCLFFGPLGWLWSFGYEGAEQKRRRKAAELSAAQAATRAQWAPGAVRG